MKELIIMIILFSLLLITQFIDQNKIIIQTYKSKFHFIMYIFLFIAILVLFRQENIIDGIKLLIFAGLVLNFGIQKEGLTETKIVKAGYVFSSDYDNYKVLEIEPFSDNNTKIKLKKNKTHKGISLILNDTPEAIERFFKERVKTDFTINIKG